MAYTWDSAAARYRDRGKFVSADTVVATSRASIAATGDIAGGLAGQYKGGSLAVKEFTTVMRQEIKDEYIRQYVLARGGLEQMTPSGWGEIGAMLKEQYKYLDGFAKDLPDLSEDAIAARAKMYINSANQAAGKGAAAAVKASGEFTEEHWDLGTVENHCDDCLGYAAQGWQPIGTFPTPSDGTTKCKSNCDCTKSYRAG